MLEWRVPAVFWLDPIKASSALRRLTRWELTDPDMPHGSAGRPIATSRHDLFLSLMMVEFHLRQICVTSASAPGRSW
jgi:hypothetical protein